MMVHSVNHTIFYRLPWKQGHKSSQEWLNSVNLSLLFFLSWEKMDLFRCVGVMHCSCSCYDSVFDVKKIIHNIGQEMKKIVTIIMMILLNVLFSTNLSFPFLFSFLLVSIFFTPFDSFAFVSLLKLPQNIPHPSSASTYILRPPSVCLDQQCRLESAFQGPPSDPEGGSEFLSLMRNLSGPSLPVPPPPRLSPPLSLHPPTPPLFLFQRYARLRYQLTHYPLSSETDR